LRARLDEHDLQTGFVTGVDAFLAIELDKRCAATRNERQAVVIQTAVGRTI
jgi:hypothetical protein